jgi:hypothetical protein
MSVLYTMMAANDVEAAEAKLAQIITAAEVPRTAGRVTFSYMLVLRFVRELVTLRTGFRMERAPVGMSVT